MSDSQSLHYLQAMGIQTWESRIAEQRLALNPWQVLEEQVRHCTLCPLHQGRTQTVFGSGNRQAKLMLIGEAPGENEDKQGEPFVGRAGQLLDAMIKSIGFQRDNIFIANILKCRPPNNRDPKPEEQTCCTPYLIQQIELIQPKLIVALGRIAAHFLLDTKTPISKLRGQLHEYHHTPLLATFHPAYLLRSPSEKAKAWLDWKMIAGYL